MRSWARRPEAGFHQVRNRGTVAGNICNAVPSADTAPALLVWKSRLKLASPRGERTVNIEDFFRVRINGGER